MTTLLDGDQNTKAKLLLLMEVGCSQRTREVPVVLLLSVQLGKTFTLQTHKLNEIQFNKSEVLVSYLQHWNYFIPQFVLFKALKSSELLSVVVWHFRYMFLVSASIANLWQQLNSSCINTVTRHVECSSLTLHICNLIRCFQFVQNR